MNYEESLNYLISLGYYAYLDDLSEDKITAFANKVKHDLRQINLRR